jgi:TP901 family phage tail tape measure protein
MAMNFDAVLRLAAKVVGLEDITKLEKGLSRVEKGAGEVKSAFGAVAGSAMWQAAAAGAAVFAAGVGYAVKAAIDFESSMSDVRKVVNGLESPEAFRQMQLEILELSDTMPIAAAGFAEIYAAAGQSGIAKAELKDFAVLVAQVSVAFDMTAQQAGTALAQMKVALGLTAGELRDLADGMNYLSNNTGSTAATLVEFMSRAGSVGKIAGLSAHETMAFGAAMIQSGVQSEVAATSFNNMVKALSKGPSMTDRQVDALRRLGYSMADAASEERRLTDAAQMESDKRVEKYRNETNQLLKEIGRRYRNQQQEMQDAAEDESREFERGLRKRTDAQIRAINEDKSLSEEAKRARIDSIQDQLDREMTARRRADRDRQQAARDRMDDQQEIERNAVTGRLKAFENSEKKFVETAKAEAKKTGEALATASKQGFADRMQKDAIGTITEVLGKINGLAKSQQISVLSDLFGDEARGLAPMIANLGELTRILGLASDATGRAGSVSNEYGVRIATAAAQLQLFWNKLHNLAILIGTTVLPYMSQLVGGLMPLLDAVGAFAKANPGLMAAAVAIGSIAAAVILALPVIAALIVSVGVLKGALAGIGLAALGPIALVAAAIVGLGAVFVLAWQRFEWFRNGITQGLAGIAQGWRGAFDIIKGIITGDSDLITKGWNTMIEGIKKATAAGFQFTMDVIRNTSQWMINLILGMPARLAGGARAIGVAIGNGIAEAVRSIFGGMLRWLADRINWVANQINRLIRAFNRLPGPDLPQIGTISVPAFAQGGTVDRPTLAMVGEGGEREYIVPESKMAAASSRFLGGARGASVIPSTSSSGAANGISPIQIAITTGPVMQDQSGQRWMTIEDGERLARQTAEQVQRQLRTPGGRYAAGVR